MSILDQAKDERPNIATVTVRHADNEKIANDVDAFLRSGGCITQIPTGVSAYRLQARAIEGTTGGTRLAWEDERLSLNKPSGKAQTMRKRMAREVERKARKR